MIQSVVIIGAGNMAYNLCHNLVLHNLSPKLVYNRSLASLKLFEENLGLKVSTNWKDINTDADLYIIATSDDAIAALGAKLRKTVSKKSIIVHTSGNKNSDVLSFDNKHYGSFYPLQSVRKERPISFREVPIFITGPDKKVNKALSAFAANISRTVEIISDDTKSKLHIPAVFVNNFVNHILAAATDYCEQEGLNFNHLLPLLEETIDRIKNGGDPRQLQTGPAIRKDKGTIKKHKEQLSENDDLKRLYNYLTKRIQAYHEEH